MDNNQTPSPRAAMLDLISGLHVSRAIGVAVQLKLADLVHGGIDTCEALAAHTHTNADALLRVVRVLAGAGVFALDAANRVSLTPLSETLLADAPGSLAAWAVSQIGDDPYRAWGALMHSVRTGDVAFEHVYGCTSWQYRDAHPESAKRFDAGMASFISTHDEALVASYPFAELRKVIDIGGGEGRLLASLLTTHPHLQGVLFEQARVIEKARARIADAGLAGRCELVAGDFFGAVPGGGDAYILSRVLHDWRDEQAIAILRNCRAAMAPQARLIIVERVVPARIEPTPAMRAILVSDLHMMVMNGGRERTEAQYRALLESAGLTLTRVTPAGSVMSIIEARPR